MIILPAAAVIIDEEVDESARGVLRAPPLDEVGLEDAPALLLSAAIASFLLATVDGVFRSALAFVEEDGDTSSSS